MTSLNQKPVFKSNYISGFTEADGCFTFTILSAKARLRVVPVFYLTQDADSCDAPAEVGRHFNNLGSLNYNPKDKTFTYKVHGIRGCEQIISHFDHHRL